MPKEERERVKKKEWITPQLIVLVRGKPEEGVLSACKTGGSSGPTVNFSAGCEWGGECPGWCFDHEPS